MISIVLTYGHGPYEPPYNTLKIKILWLGFEGKVLTVNHVQKQVVTDGGKVFIDMWIVTVRLVENGWLLLITYLEPDEKGSPIISITRIDSPKFEKIGE
jgi:hypothetical protein